MDRPKRTRKDANHAQIRDELRNAGYIVIDTADLPGHPEHNPLDMFVINPYFVQAPVVVACSADGIKRWFAECRAYGPIVQVEIKTSAAAPFTKDEETYLRELGLWPPEFWV